jgi:sulfite dehydrogenase (cytochrome) subunit B
MRLRTRHAGVALALGAAFAIAAFDDPSRAADATARATGTAPSAAAAEVTQLRAGEGHDLTERSCNICHSVEYIPANAPAMDRGAWQKTIQKMKDRFGAPITDQDAKQILDYLAAIYSGKSG